MNSRNFLRCVAAIGMLALTAAMCSQNNRGTTKPPSPIEGALLETTAVAAFATQATDVSVTNLQDEGIAQACRDSLEIAADYKMSDEQSATAYYDLASVTADERLAASFRRIASLWESHAEEVFDDYEIETCRTAR